MSELPDRAMMPPSEAAPAGHRRCAGVRDDVWLELRAMHGRRHVVQAHLPAHRLRREEHLRRAPPPPPKVSLAAPAKRPVTRYLESTGYVAAVNSADLVACVAGFVEAIKYGDGYAVKKARFSSSSSRSLTN